MEKFDDATIRNIAEVLWDTAPGHYEGAHSKLLVTPDTDQTKHFDFRISVYQPKGYVATHHHTRQEQIYFVLAGEGLMELGSERRVVRRNDTIFIPPGLDHALYNTGLRDLTFLVITSPPTDE